MYKGLSIALNVNLEPVFAVMQKCADWHYQFVC